MTYTLLLLSSKQVHRLDLLPSQQHGYPTLTFGIDADNQTSGLANSDERPSLERKSLLTTTPDNKICELSRHHISFHISSNARTNYVISCIRQQKLQHYASNATTFHFQNDYEIWKFIRFLLHVLRNRVYVRADQVYMRSAIQWEVATKFDAVLSNNHYRIKRLDVLIDVATACYVAAITNIDLVDGLKTTAVSITSTAATNTATLGIETAAQVVGNAVAGAAISAIVDVAVSSATIYVAKRQKDEGRITEEEYSTKIKKTVCESSCKFVGGTTGSIIGQVLIPVPVVGAFVGGFCGSLIGAGIGKGINYGVFDRKSKKIVQDTTVSDNMHLKMYRRKFRGFVPRITIYNESSQQFEEKVFQKTIKNYLRPELNVEGNSSKKSSSLNTENKEKEMIATYLKKWRRHSSIDQTDEQHAIDTTSSVFSRWIRSTSNNNNNNNNNITNNNSISNNTNQEVNSISHRLSTGKSLEISQEDTVNSASQSPLSTSPRLSLTPAEDEVLTTTNQECKDSKDCLSPTQNMFQRVRSFTCTKSNDTKENNKATTTNIRSVNRLKNNASELRRSASDGSPFEDREPGVRLSMRSLKDSFRVLSNSQSSEFSDKEDKTDASDTQEEFQHGSQAMINDGSMSPLLRLKNFRSTFKDHNCSHPDEPLDIQTGHALSNFETIRNNNNPVTETKEHEVEAYATKNELKQKSNDNIYEENPSDHAKRNDCPPKTIHCPPKTRLHYTVSSPIPARYQKQNQTSSFQYNLQHGLAISETDLEKEDHDDLKFKDNRRSSFVTSTEEIAKKARDLFVNNIGTKILSFSTTKIPDPCTGDESAAKRKCSTPENGKNSTAENTSFFSDSKKTDHKSDNRNSRKKERTFFTPSFRLINNVVVEKPTAVQHTDPMSKVNTSKEERRKKNSRTETNCQNTRNLSDDENINILSLDTKEEDFDTWNRKLRQTFEAKTSIAFHEDDVVYDGINHMNSDQLPKQYRQQNISQQENIFQQHYHQQQQQQQQENSFIQQSQIQRQEPQNHRRHLQQLQGKKQRKSQQKKKQVQHHQQQKYQQQQQQENKQQLSTKQPPIQQQEPQNQHQFQIYQQKQKFQQQQQQQQQNKQQPFSQQPQIQQHETQNQQQVKHQQQQKQPKKKQSSNQQPQIQRQHAQNQQQQQLNSKEKHLSQAQMGQSKSHSSQSSDARENIRSWFEDKTKGMNLSKKQEEESSADLTFTKFFQNNKNNTRKSELEAKESSAKKENKIFSAMKKFTTKLK